MASRIVAVVYDEKRGCGSKLLRRAMYERADLQPARELRKSLKGVSAIVYIQDCAAEKRRRRKRGLFPDPDKARVSINTDVCRLWGLVVCSPNCVLIVPEKTELDRKRRLIQIVMQQGFFCWNGFLPVVVDT